MTQVNTYTATKGIQDKDIEMKNNLIITDEALSVIQSLVYVFGGIFIFIMWLRRTEKSFDKSNGEKIIKSINQNNLERIAPLEIKVESIEKRVVYNLNENNKQWDVINPSKESLNLLKERLDTSEKDRVREREDNKKAHKEMMDLMLEVSNGVAEIKGELKSKK